MAVRLPEVVKPADVLVRHLTGDPQLVVEPRQVRASVHPDALGRNFNATV